MFPPDVGVHIAEFFERDEEAKALRDAWLKNGGSTKDLYHIANPATLTQYAAAMSALSEDGDFYKVTLTMYSFS